MTFPVRSPDPSGIGVYHLRGLVRVKFSGPAGDVNIPLGGIVSPNLALHATLFGWTITDPDVEISTITGTIQGDLAIGGIGGGLTYYLMPANLYLSGTIGVGTMKLDNAGPISGETGGGLIFDLTFGKEWWVGDNWGIGVALGLGIHFIPESGHTDNWSWGNVALRFTATLN